MNSWIITTSFLVINVPNNFGKYAWFNFYMHDISCLIAALFVVLSNLNLGYNFRATFLFVLLSYANLTYAYAPLPRTLIILKWSKEYFNSVWATLPCLSFLVLVRVFCRMLLNFLIDDASVSPDKNVSISSSSSSYDDSESTYAK